MIPVFLFLSVMAGYVFHRYFRFRAQQEVQTTLRLALEKGNGLTPEALAALVPRPDRHADRRRAILSLMIALAIAGFAIMIGGQEASAVGPLFGIACFPLFLSFAYFWLSRRPAEERESQASTP